MSNGRPQRRASPRRRPAPRGPPQRPRLSRRQTPTGPGGRTGRATQVCQPNDSTPVGTVVDGYRKIERVTLFGRTSAAGNPRGRGKSLAPVKELIPSLRHERYDSPLTLTALLAGRPLSTATANSRPPRLNLRPEPAAQPADAAGQPHRSRRPGHAGHPEPPLRRCSGIRSHSAAAPAVPPRPQRLTDSGGFLLNNVSLTEMIDILGQADEDQLHSRSRA